MNDYGFMMDDVEVIEALRDYCDKRIAQQKALNHAMQLRKVATEQLGHVFVYSKPSQFPNRTFEYTDVDGNTVTLDLNPFAHQPETFVVDCRVQMGEPDLVYRIVDTSMQQSIQAMMEPVLLPPEPVKLNYRPCSHPNCTSIVRIRKTTEPLRKHHWLCKDHYEQLLAENPGSSLKYLMGLDMDNYSWRGEDNV